VEGKQRNIVIIAALQVRGNRGGGDELKEGGGEEGGHILHESLAHNPACVSGFSRGLWTPVPFAVLLVSKRPAVIVFFRRFHKDAESHKNLGTLSRNGKGSIKNSPFKPQIMKSLRQQLLGLHYNK